MTTIPGLLAAIDPGRPAISDADGTLSGADLRALVARTANLLADRHPTATTAAVLLPPHRLTAVVLLGCWSVGIGVQSGGVADLDFIDMDSIDEGESEEEYVVATTPMPVRDTYRDFARSIAGYRPAFSPTVSEDAVASWERRPLTQADLCRQAAAYAHRPVPPGETDYVRWLLAPLAAGAEVVLDR